MRRFRKPFLDFPEREFESRSHRKQFNLKTDGFARRLSLLVQHQEIGLFGANLSVSEIEDFEAVIMKIGVGNLVKYRSKVGGHLFDLCA